MYKNFGGRFSLDLRTIVFAEPIALRTQKVPAKILVDVILAAASFFACV